MARLRLISFKLCPFVQRSVIALELKQQSYEIKYIDLANKPDWFLKLSPLGKVPVLQVDEHILFESAVINEYLDETLAPQLHPVDPLQRARHRAWIEVASGLLGHQFQMTTADSMGAARDHEAKLFDGLVRIADQVGDGPYFGDKEPTLVDAAIAPLFTRMDILERHFEVGRASKNAVLSTWRDALLGLDAVQRSVVEDFEERYVSYVAEKGALKPKSD